jgi:hypothetical protein
MMTSVLDALKQLGVPSNQIRTEVFRLQ